MVRNKVRSSILSVCLATSLMVPSYLVPSAAAAETGVDGHWASKEMTNWKDLDFIRGYEDGSLHPDATITRAEFAALINRLFAFETKASISFGDVQSTDWFYDDIAKAKAAGYLSGYEDGSIKPNQPISRQEVASILNAIVKPSSSSSTNQTNSFKDDADIPNWSRQAVQAMTTSGFMNGYPDQTFQPSKSITRSEAVVTLDRSKQISSSLVRYSSPGAYTDSAKGNVIIGSPDVKLNNMVIEGNLVVTEDVGEGNVLLHNVTVKGKTVIKGGGPNSIVLEDSTLRQVEVRKENGNVRLLASGSTTVLGTQMESGGKLEDKSKTGNAFGQVLVDKMTPSHSVVTLAGSFDQIAVNAPDITVQVDNGKYSRLTTGVEGKPTSIIINDGSVKELNIGPNTKLEVRGGNVENLTVSKNASLNSIVVSNTAIINNLILNAPVSITGSGAIVNVTVNANGSQFEKQPQNITLGQGITTSVGGVEIKTSTSLPGAVSSGGSSSSSSSYRPIDVTPPAVPTGLKADAGNGSVSLSWNANTDYDLAGYNVYNGTTKLSTVTATTYAVTGLQNGSSYTFSVSAVDKNGNESAKAQVVATPVAPGGQPSNLLFVPTVNPVDDSSLIVTGQAQAGATVTVKVGPAQLGTATADITGAYSVAIAKQGAGTTLEVITSNGISSSNSVFALVFAASTPSASALIADATHNRVGSDLEITFADNSAWRSKISTVKVAGKVLTSNQYSVTAGKLTINASVFTAAGNYSIVVNATGYRYATLLQAITPNVILTELAAPTNLQVAGTSVTWNTVLNAQGYSVTILNGTTTVKTVDVASATIDLAAQSLATGNYTVKVKAKGDNISFSNSTDSSVSGAISIINSVPPVFTETYPKAGTIGFTQAELKVMTNEDGHVYYAVVASGTSAPTTAAVKNQSVSAVVQGQDSLTANTESTIVISGLTNSTSYDIYAAIDDNSGDLQPTLGKVSITTAAPDVTPPIFTVTSGTVTSTTYSYNVKSNETGKVYYVAVAHNDLAPTAAQIKVGNNNASLPALKSGQVTVSAVNTDVPFTISGLTAGASYDLYIVAEDAALNLAAPQKLNMNPVVTLANNISTPSSVTSAQPFNVTITVINLTPNTQYDLQLGTYMVSGGAQVGQFQNDDGTWPTGYAYQTFKVTTDANGVATKTLVTRTQSGKTGAATIKLRKDSTTTYATTTITIN